MRVKKKTVYAKLLATILMVVVTVMMMPGEVSAGSPINLTVSVIDPSLTPPSYVEQPGLSATFTPDGAVIATGTTTLSIDDYNPMVYDTPDAGYSILVEYTATVETGVSNVTGTLVVPIPSGYTGVGAKIKGGANATSYTATTVSFPLTITSGFGGIYVEFKSDSTTTTSTSSTSTSGHTHYYQWKVTTPATAGSDGVLSNVCSCGKVEATQTITANSYYLNDTLADITKAAQGANLVFDSNQWNSFPKSVMLELAGRRDLTVTFCYDYLGKHYKVVIPAGTPIDTTCDWYGPLKLYSIYGGTVTE